MDNSNQGESNVSAMMAKKLIYQNERHQLCKQYDEAEPGPAKWEFRKKIDRLDKQLRKFRNVYR